MSGTVSVAKGGSFEEGASQVSDRYERFIEGAAEAGDKYSETITKAVAGEVARSAAKAC